MTDQFEMHDELNDRQLNKVAGGSEIVITKQTDAASVGLFQSASGGGLSFEKVAIAFRFQFFF
jgi:hypothetical protein